MKKAIITGLFGLLGGVLLYLTKIGTIAKQSEQGEQTGQRICELIKKEFPDKTEDEYKELINEAKNIVEMINKYTQEMGEHGDLAGTIIKILKEKRA